MAIFSLMVFLVNMILQGSADHVRLTETKMHLQESLRESLYRMGLEIRESAPSRATITNGGAAITFQIPAGVSNSGVITWSSPIAYQIGGNGTQLVRLDIATNQTSVLANDIQSVVFTAHGFAFLEKAASRALVHDYSNVAAKKLGYVAAREGIRSDFQ